MKYLVMNVTSSFKTYLRCQQAANRVRYILFQLHRGFEVMTSGFFTSIAGLGKANPADWPEGVID